MLERTALGIIREIIEQYNKMAFVSGPRQVGKTTLAKRYQVAFRFLREGEFRQGAELRASGGVDFL